jgi:uncharacterized protein (DUF58 family)
MSTPVSPRFLPPALVSRLNTLEFRARQIVEGFITGLHKSPYHGFSVEFAEHKAYNAGESLRNIDWKVFGKTERLFSKKFAEETNLRCYLVLDVSDSMRYPVPGGKEPIVSKLEYGITLSAALGYLMLHQRDAIGLALYDDRLQYFMPAKARRTWLVQVVDQLAQTLAQAQVFTRRTATADVLHQLAQKLGKRALVVIVSDFIAAPAEAARLHSALQHLRHEQHEVLLIRVAETKTEDAFDLPDQPLVLKDLETGSEVRLHPQQMRAQYVAAMQTYLHQLQRKCRELAIDFVTADIGQPYERTLLDYLRKRNKLL